MDSNSPATPFPDDRCLISVVIPAYNEVDTLRTVIDRVRACGMNCEIVVIDDGSTDGTGEILRELRSAADLTICSHPRNRGKGAALRTAFPKTRGDLVLIQDADLEYAPNQLSALIQPIVQNEADVVFGSRYADGDPRTDTRWHRFLNQCITWLSNRRTGLALTDVETCYKVFRGDLIRQLAPQLREEGFGIEIEVTSKLRGCPACGSPNVPFAMRRERMPMARRLPGGTDCTRFGAFGGTDDATGRYVATTR